MAQKLNPKDAFIENRVNIVKGLENADDVASHLFASRLFTEEMRDVILQEKEKEKKNRELLNTLDRRGKLAVKRLYEAFVDTKNKELADLLAAYVKVLESDENRFSPSCWPPEEEDQKRMESEPLRRIKDKKSPFVVQDYTDHANVYKMRNKTRGMVFMINNVKFSKKTPVKLGERKGSDIDARNLRNLFNELQFIVVDKKDLDAQEMLDFLKEESDKVNWNDMECVILIIMSHGDAIGVYGTDGASAELSKFTDILKKYPGLDGKPKLVFVQACRGTITETDQEQLGEKQVSDGMEELTLNQKDESDAAKSENKADAAKSGNTDNTTKTIHSEADFLIAYATPEGTPSYRHEDVGSWFLNAIVWTFKYHADHEDIQHLLTKVNQLVSKGRTEKGLLQVSEVSHRLTKKFYFFPGVYDDPPKLLEE